MNLRVVASQLRAMHDSTLLSDVSVARGLAHAKFDLIWKRKLMPRHDAYTWLQKQMRMTPDEAHMEHMTAEQCAKVIRCVERNFPCFR